MIYLLTSIYTLLALYSILCAPDLYFTLFEFRDSPEDNIAYLAFCLVVGATLIPAIWRLEQIRGERCK